MGREAAIAASELTDGAKELLRGLMWLGRTAVFAGGAAGLDYAGLLKRAACPDIVGGYVAEAGAVLQEREVDLLLAPGMSGFAIGTVYAMSADPVALLNVSRGLFIRQATGATGGSIELRVAGADDIWDKAAMAQACIEIESASRLGRYAVEHLRDDWPAPVGDHRPMSLMVEMVTWVTPFLKAYTRAQQQLPGLLETPTVEGLGITGIYTSPRAVGIERVGVPGFA